MPEELIVLIVCLFAGCGAGLGTGFAGMSAAAVISPMLIAFLGVDPYIAVGVALASDVLASAASAITYHKNKNIDIKNGIIMMIAVLVFTFLGSYLSQFVPSTTMGSFSTLMTLFIGIKFIVKPVVAPKQSFKESTAKSKAIKAIIFGSIVGMICGFVGAGGGMMMLIILTSVLGYELKTAVGTSVFIMAFTALTGSVSHFAFSELPDILILVSCVTFTLLFALLASKFANKAEPKTLSRITGVILVILGIAILIVNYI